MNLLKEYRKVCGITQSDLVDELRNEDFGIDVPLLSKMERGVCEPSSQLKDYINNQIKLRDLELSAISQVCSKTSLKKLLERPVYFDIYKMISKGSFDQPVTKSYIKSITGLKDREIRRIIYEFRNAGVRVYASSGSIGYWICQTEAEYKTMRTEMISRAKTLFREVAAMDRWDPNQIEMEVD